MVPGRQPQALWKPVVQEICQTTGLVFSAFTYSASLMCQQLNSNDCGPISCGVVWTLLTKLMPLRQTLPANEDFSVNKYDKKTEPLRPIIWKKKQDLVTLYKDDLMVKIRNQKANKPNPFESLQVKEWRDANRQSPAKRTRSQTVKEDSLLERPKRKRKGNPKYE